MSEWKIARYRVRTDMPSLAAAYAAGGLQPGDIVQRGPVAILGCPSCGALQFTPQVYTGHVDAPNLLQPIHCGAGACRRCGKWFIIQTGQPRPVERP